MLIKISDKVKQALDNNVPVVALESTIISHGMPYPFNVQTALNVEKIIEEQGCVAATIGIIDGVGIIGMDHEEIEQFGKKKGIVKVSRRDLPIVMAKKMWGATTVATTMILASKANIEVFVTGGIGGVHRNAQQTFDISADLQELAHTNVTVVCAGAKAILDLPLTLEYLETFGVPVLGYKSDNLAAFYSKDSGLKLDYNMADEAEIAKAIYYKRKLDLKGGILVSNPIPNEASIDNDYINQKIDEALKEANKQNIKGKDVTPFLLSYIAKHTQNKSLDANIALIYNNAKIGANIAKEYMKLKTDK
ncbi:MAG: pseudouridine-5'-phosphate glycosidase [Erysipelotrichaceae bacterium]|nr:pseudouridine-5'-phosphate glycosidase [Erysipelotrichaceae bacterium]